MKWLTTDVIAAPKMSESTDRKAFGFCAQRRDFLVRFSVAWYSDPCVQLVAKGPDHS